MRAAPPPVITPWRSPRLLVLAAFAVAATVGWSVGGASAVSSSALDGVHFSGPRYFEAVGTGSAPPITATLTLDYRLSPSFRNGTELRVFLGYAEDDQIFFHNGSKGWNNFEITDGAAPNYTSVSFNEPGVSAIVRQLSLGYPYLGLTVSHLSGAHPGGFMRVVIGDTRLGSPGYEIMRNESTVQILVQEREPGSSEWRMAWPTESFPTLAIGGVRADRFVLTAPSTAAPGATVELTIKPAQNEDSPYLSSPLVLKYAGTVSLSGSDPGMHFPSSWTFRSADHGLAVLRVTLPNRAGIYRLSAEEEGNPAVIGESNPIVVGAQLPAHDFVPMLYWGSLHNHAMPSGHAIETPEFAYRYAREYADLDFYALTDHCSDAMSFRQFRWSELRTLAREFTAPGSFVAYSGFEWTSRSYGHRHVVFRDAEMVNQVPCDMPSTGNLLAGTLGEVEAALASPNAMMIPHHPAWTQNQPMNWGASLDNPLQPLVEIYSWHGSSESYDSRFPMHNDLQQQHPAGSGAWVQEALAAGYRFGFTGDSDNHKGRAGSNNGGNIPDGNPAGVGLFARMGITGVFTKELKRDAIWEGLRARRTIATTGARIAGGFTVNGHFLGESFTDSAPPRIRMRIHGTDLLEEVVVFRDGDEIVYTAAPGTRDFAAEFVDLTAIPGVEHSYYVRAIQDDGHHLWMSPIWMRYEP